MRVIELTDEQREQLYTDFKKFVTANPYTDYPEFFEQVKKRVIFNLPIVSGLRDIIKDINPVECPAVVYKNMPIDVNQPVFDNDDPVKSKYELKKTFISEATLTFIGFMIGSLPFSFRTINGGDIFHDVYLQNSLADTASQKSSGDIGFHYDMGFFKVRPDFANLICLRNSTENLVSTTVCRDIDILNGLTKKQKVILAQPIFYTKKEVLQAAGSGSDEDMPLMPVYYPDRAAKLGFFEGRTTSDNEEAKKVLNRIYVLLREHKQQFFFEPGDLLSINNNNCIHCREVLAIGDMEEHRQRWIIKTYNTNDMSHFENGPEFISDE